MTARVRDPDGDNLVEWRFQLPQESTRFWSRYVLPRHRIRAVRDPSDQEINRVEDLARMLVKDGRRAGNGLLVLA